MKMCDSGKVGGERGGRQSHPGEIVMRLPGSSKGFPKTGDHGLKGLVPFPGILSHTGARVE